MLSLHSGKCVVNFGVRPGAGDAAFGIDDDVATLDQPGLQQRGQGQNGRRRVAARDWRPVGPATIASRNNSGRP